MAYCPECLAEYVEGVKECSDCRVPLLPGVPPAPRTNAGWLDDSAGVRLVRLRIFSGPTAQLNAALARNLLDTQGIPCTLTGGTPGGVLPGVDVVQLLVRKDDAVRAEEVLASYLDSSGEVQAD